MAYYSYKRVLDVIPKDYYENFAKGWEAESGREFEGSADYDGDLWCMAADYIDHLHGVIKTLEEGKK